MTRTTSAMGIAAVGAALVLVGGPASGQVPTVRLSSPEAAFPEAFGLISGFRELPDGRVMIGDPLGQALVIADLSAGTADTIGRVGGGPEEYQQPDGLFALAGDSTLLVDLGNARLTVIGPDGEFGETMPIVQQGGEGPRGMMFVLPQAVDSRGRVYFQPPGFGRGGTLPDSGAVVRFDRATKTMDTVGMVKLTERRRQASGGAGNQRVSITTVPLSPQDNWAVSWDGRVAFARSGDYRIDWVDEDGREAQGPAVDYRPVRAGRGEKEEWLASQGVGGLSIQVSIQNGAPSANFGRGGGGGTASIDDYDNWPDVLPPFQQSRTWVSPEGDVWVQRYTQAGGDSTFDVFDGTGRYTKQIVLPPSRRVVGFGDGVVYVVSRDEFDLEYLERYEMN